MEKYIYLAAISEIRKKHKRYAVCVDMNYPVFPGDILSVQIPNEGAQLCKTNAVTLCSINSDVYRLAKTLCPMLPEAAVTAVYHKEEIRHADT